MFDTGSGTLSLAALMVSSLLSVRLLAAEPQPDADAAAPAPTCLEAIVSPVSGYAECVNPRGAPVPRPPPRPAADCAQSVHACTDTSGTDTSGTTVEPDP